MMNEELTITLHLVGRVLRLTIPRAEEEKYRKAAVKINSLFLQYKGKLAKADLDNELLLLMLACHLAVETYDAAHDVDLLPYVNEVTRVSEYLKDYLAKVEQ